MMNRPCLIGVMLLVQALQPGPMTLLPSRFAVPVSTCRKLSPSHLAVGTQVEVKVSYDLRWQGCLVFREGTPVTATISEVHGPDVVGKPSLIVLDILSTVAVDGTIVPLSGSIRAEGEDRMMESIGAAIGVCCLGIFLPGGRQSIGKGVGTVALTTAEVEIRCTEK
jgi:hypothetical protein